MKKVYLITASNKNDLKMNCIIEVFTNKQLAEAYIKYWNNVENHDWVYHMSERKVCKADYRVFPF